MVDTDLTVLDTHTHTHT